MVRLLVIRNTFALVVLLAQTVSDVDGAATEIRTDGTVAHTGRSPLARLERRRNGASKGDVSDFEGQLGNARRQGPALRNVPSASQATQLATVTAGRGSGLVQDDSDEAQLVEAAEDVRQQADMQAETRAELFHMLQMKKSREEMLMEDAAEAEKVAAIETANEQAEVRAEPKEEVLAEPAAEEGAAEETGKEMEKALAHKAELAGMAHKQEAVEEQHEAKDAETAAEALKTHTAQMNIKQSKEGDKEEVIAEQKEDKHKLEGNGNHESQKGKPHKIRNEKEAAEMHKTRAPLDETQKQARIENKAVEAHEYLKQKAHKEKMMEAEARDKEEAEKADEQQVESGDDLKKKHDEEVQQEATENEEAENADTQQMEKVQDQNRAEDESQAQTQGSAEANGDVEKAVRADLEKPHNETLEEEAVKEQKQAKDEDKADDVLDQQLRSIEDGDSGTDVKKDDESDDDSDKEVGKDDEQNDIEDEQAQNALESEAQQAADMRPDEMSIP